jgi:hypothetical protein
MNNSYRMRAEWVAGRPPMFGARAPDVERSFFLFYGKVAPWIRN